MDPTGSHDAATPGHDADRESESIATRAYRSYVRQGSTHGHDVRDWLEAEAQLLAERPSMGNRPAYSL